MAFYISGPKVLFETTEISTHPNSTQSNTRQNGEWTEISTRQNEIELAMFGE
jgi:hypothetical protein